MGVAVDDGFETVVQHDGGAIEVAMVFIPDPFGGPDGAVNVGVPEFAGVAVDDVFGYLSERLESIVLAEFAQDDGRCGAAAFLDENGPPGAEVCL